MRSSKKGGKNMKFQEPKVEFIPVDEMITTDGSNGQETHMCGGTSYQPDPDSCSADPSYF